MDEVGFRQFLKKMGKKEHVINGLVNQVQIVEAYLGNKHQTSLEHTTVQTIQEYTTTLNQKETKTRMRGLALYYKFIGNIEMATLANSLREQEIAKTRQSFKLRQFRGIHTDDIAKLEAVGIVTVDDMLAAGATPQARQNLAEKTAVSPEAILELVKLSDISRIGAIKSVRARLYYEAGLDTPDKFTQWEPEDLCAMLIEFVEQTDFDGIAPLPKEIRTAISKAKQLPRMITY